MESYCVNVKHTLDDEKLKDKIEESEKTSLRQKVTEIENWLGSNQEADVSEYEAKQKEIENMFNPIMQRVYQAAGGAEGGMPGGMPGGMGGFPGGMGGFPGGAGGSSGPKVDEVD